MYEFILERVMVMHFLRQLCVCLGFMAISSSGAQMTEWDQLKHATYRDGGKIPYLLSARNPQSPTTVFILQPGGSGSMYLWANFLIRSRSLFADEQTLVVTTDATSSPERIQAIIEDLNQAYPGLKAFLIGTSNGTFSTMRLGHSLDGQIAGFIHTSSLNALSSYDTRAFKSRHLIVHHEEDGCRLTLYSAALGNHQKFGTDFISVRGGSSVGDPCMAHSHHGYHGIEKDVVQRIKAWAMGSEFPP
jgi:predicted esterase